MNILNKELTAFLIRAKKATYAGKGAEASPSRQGSHDLEYREGELMYYDSYLGGDRFAGEEALWVSGVPIWSMNYVGRVTGDNFSGDFLKQALLAVPEDKPFRGPEVFEDESYPGYVFRCGSEGDTEWFRGYETIELDGNVIYECYFHGGAIK